MIPRADAKGETKTIFSFGYDIMYGFLSSLGMIYDTSDPKFVSLLCKCTLMNYNTLY